MLEPRLRNFRLVREARASMGTRVRKLELRSSSTRFTRPVRGVIGQRIHKQRESWLAPEQNCRIFWEGLAGAFECMFLLSLLLQYMKGEHWISSACYTCACSVKLFLL